MSADQLPAWQEHLCDHLIDSRVEAKISMRELARRLKKTSMYVHHVETGENSMACDALLMEWASIIGLNPEETVALSNHIDQPLMRYARDTPGIANLLRLLRDRDIDVVMVVHRLQSGEL